MANESNLKPVRSTREARERGQKGGLKSGEVRREKKLFKDILEIMLEQKNEDGVLNEKELIAYKAIQQAKDGDDKARNFIRDTIGEKPIDKVEIDDISELRESYDTVSEAIKNKNKRE